MKLKKNTHTININSFYDRVFSASSSAIIRNKGGASIYRLALSVDAGENREIENWIILLCIYPIIYPDKKKIRFTARCASWHWLCSEHFFFPSPLRLGNETLTPKFKISQRNSHIKIKKKSFFSQANAFIAKYGTHFVDTVVMGGKVTQESIGKGSGKNYFCLI